MNKKLLLIPAITIILLLGTTLAYYAWTSSNEQNTNIGFEVDGIYVAFIGGADIVGFDLAAFMENNQEDFKNEIYNVLKILSEN